MADLSFRKGFESTFGKGMEIGSKAAQTSIEENIKKQAEKAKKETKLASIQMAGNKLSKKIVEMGGDEEIANSLNEVLVSTKDPDIAEKIFNTALKTSEGIFKTKQEGNKGAFVVQRTPEGKQQLVNAITGEVVTDPKQVSARSQIFKETLTPEQIMERERAKADVALETKPQIAAATTEATKQVERKFDIQKQFDKMQTDLISSETELTSDQKVRLVSAKQGQQDIIDAKELLGNDLTLREIFSSGTGPLATIASFNNESARKLQTSVQSSIFNYVFAKSGAQVSDKERQAFSKIYGPTIGDTFGSVDFKLNKLNSLFDLTSDILDPNKVSGLTVKEKAAKIELIKAEMLSTGAKEGDVKTAIDAIMSITDKNLKQDDGKLNANIFDDLMGGK